MEDIEGQIVVIVDGLQDNINDMKRDIRLLWVVIICLCISGIVIGSSVFLGMVVDFMLVLKVMYEMIV